MKAWSRSLTEEQRQRWLVPQAKGEKLATFGLTAYLYVAIPKGFFPQQDTGQLTGRIHADQSISFQAMRDKLAAFIDIVRADPAVESVVGFTGGSQRNTGSMFVTLKPLAERGESADRIVARLRTRLARHYYRIARQRIGRGQLHEARAALERAYHFAISTENELERQHDDPRHAQHSVRHRAHFAC